MLIYRDFEQKPPAAATAGTQMATAATPAEMAVVYRKYAAEGPAGFHLQTLSARLRDFLQPVYEELTRIIEFSDEYNPCCGGRYGRDSNDTETAGFCKRALRLYEAATYAGLADPERDLAELVAALENIRDYPSPTAALLQFIARDALARHAPGREAKA